MVAPGWDIAIGLLATTMPNTTMPNTTMPQGTRHRSRRMSPAIRNVPGVMSPLETLNPAQRATLAALGAGDPSARDDFGPDLAPELRRRLEAGLADVADSIDPANPLIVTKHLLAGIHGCQARFLDERARPFEPSVPVVRGTIVHKALELAVHWPGTPLPLELVDEAIARTTHADHWAADFLATLAPADHAELRGSAGDTVGKFLETWPPLTPAMRPATEARLWTELCDRRIVLKGQADLTLGQNVASGTETRKIIIDHKTGSRSPDHRADLRFYALVETLRIGVPPRLCVTAYLVPAELETETITPDVLFATAARVIDGVRRYRAITHDGDEPTRTPSSACRWCPLLDTCDVGLTHLDQAR